MLEKGLKLVALTFVSFMHYIATMLAFFIPIDIASKVFGIPQFHSILIGSIVLWFWSFVTGWIIIKTLEK